MKTRLTALMTAAVLPAAVMAGCGTGPVAAEPDYVSAESYPQVTLDPDLRGKVYFGQPVVTKPADGPMSVSVPIRYVKNKPLNAQYQFLFLDATGRPLGPDMTPAWKQLPPRSRTYVEATSLHPSAEDWQLHIRPEAE